MSLPSSPRGEFGRCLADRDTFWRRRSERTSRVQRQGSNHSVSGGQGGVYRRVKGVLDGSKSECETEDAFGENIDQVEEGREVSQDAPAESDAARIFSGQLVMKATDRDRQDSLPEERGVMVWGEETTLAVSREELAPVVAAAVEERGTKVVFEAELDSTLNRDRNTISNSIFVGDENLTIVPIEVTDSIPDHHAVPQTSPSEVMVLGADNVVKSSE
ncbi:hypothetical protein V6N11_071533 [Hibiscus sabdariffa]|uniref:Uncharacterized protein n=1 Tax=Hibiscus sabdariffa TaxID=183260 RepID=A0ABR2U0E6_9ROSI